MLPVLAALNLLCAWQVRRLARPTVTDDAAVEAMDDAPADLGSRPSPPLRPARARASAVPAQSRRARPARHDRPPRCRLRLQGAGGRGLRTRRRRCCASSRSTTPATSLLTFVVQTTSSRLALERLGLALTTSTPSLALCVGGLVRAGRSRGLAAPSSRARRRVGVPRIAVPHRVRDLLHADPADEKRAAKSIIDVGFDRLGDAVGGGLVRIVLSAARCTSVRRDSVAGDRCCAAAAMLVASRLNRGYIQTLERSLLNRAVELDLSDVEDITTRTVDAAHARRDARATAA